MSIRNPKTPQERTERNRQLKTAAMKLDWSSWEWLFRDDIQRLEYRIQACYDSMKTAGIPREMREAFVLDKLREIITEVTNEQKAQ